jgi:peptidoglycan/LPS O-acetylase OafA/YrhL
MSLLMCPTDEDTKIAIISLTFGVLVGLYVRRRMRPLDISATCSLFLSMLVLYTVYKTYPERNWGCYLLMSMVSAIATCYLT